MTMTSFVLAFAGPACEISVGRRIVRVGWPVGAGPDGPSSPAATSAPGPTTERARAVTTHQTRIARRTGAMTQRSALGGHGTAGRYAGTAYVRVFATSAAWSSAACSS